MQEVKKKIRFAKTLRLMLSDWPTGPFARLPPEEAFYVVDGEKSRADRKQYYHD